MKSRRVSPKETVTCDKCGREIVLSSSALKTKRFPDGIRISYFSCGRCGEKYIYLVTDPELRKDIKRRGFCGSFVHMKMRALELKTEYAHRIKEPEILRAENIKIKAENARNFAEKNAENNEKSPENDSKMPQKCEENAPKTSKSTANLEIADSADINAVMERLAGLEAPGNCILGNVSALSFYEHLHSRSKEE